MSQPNWRRRAHSRAEEEEPREEKIGFSCLLSPRSEDRRRGSDVPWGQHLFEEKMPKRRRRRGKRVTY
jgi:hypothetical protein